MFKPNFMQIQPPLSSEFAPYYGTYVSKVNSADLLAALQENKATFAAFVNNLPAAKADYSYAPGKWTVKEVITHLTDAERIFAYRALRFARNDQTALSGFDENEYVPESNAAARTLEEILEEWLSVRQATINLFKSLTRQMALREGKANGQTVSVRALGYIVIGHTIHHQQVIAERYL